MTKEKFTEIVDYIKETTTGTCFEGHVYIVGGAVRDLVMKNEIKDIDIVVDIENGGENLANFYRDSNLSESVVIYPAYGTAMFKFRKFPDYEIECVQTRKEQYKDKSSRNPETTFGTITEDANRRDLTINALYYNVSKGMIVDVTGKGIGDISGHVIRTTNDNPDIVFIDDPLRILRCVRFSSRYGWKIDKETMVSMSRNVDRLGIITHERIRDEFEKILMSGHAVRGIRTLMDIGAMKYIIPELELTVDMSQNRFHFGTVYEHTLVVVQNYLDRFKPDVICLLACLLHDIGKISTRTVDESGNVHFYEHENQTELVKDILKRLKYDNKTISEVCFIVKNHMRTKQFGDGCEKIRTKSLNKLVYTCFTKERYEKLCRVIECDNLAHKPEYCIHGQYDFFMEQITKNHMFGYHLPVNGDEIMEYLGIEPGKTVKLVMDILLKHAFNNPEITKERCLKLSEGLLKQIV